MKRILDPRKIEDESFRLIDRHLKSSKLSFTRRGPKEMEIARRVIHTTADLDYARDLLFHPCAVEAGMIALREGKDIVTDVHMVKAGINEKLLTDFGGRTVCLLNDKEVIKQSSKLKITRAILAMRKAARLMDGAIVAIGNAPTALFEICELVRLKAANPSLIVGVPVGFVQAQESKKELLSLDTPYITNKSKKGGSSVAAAIINALLILAIRG